MGFAFGICCFVILIKLVSCVYLLLVVFVCLVGCWFNSVVSGFCVFCLIVVGGWCCVCLMFLLLVGCFCYCLVVCGLVGLL